MNFKKPMFHKDNLMFTGFMAVVGMSTTIIFFAFTFIYLLELYYE